MTGYSRAVTLQHGRFNCGLLCGTCPVGLRTYAEVVEKDASQRFGAAETRNLRGISDGAAGVKCRARHIDSNHFDIARRSCPQFGLKHPGQLSRAQGMPGLQASSHCGPCRGWR